MNSTSAGVSRFTLEDIKPHLRPELDRRIIAIAQESAEQVGENREAMIDATLRRFAGWTTTAPTKADRKPRIRQTDLLSAMTRLPLEERRRQVILHEGFRFRASLGEMLAISGGSIAMIWTVGCCGEEDNSPDHHSRDGKCYALRKSWALERGSMQVGPNGYYEEISKVASEHYCRCHACWVYSVSGLPDAMITSRGKAEIVRIKAILGA